MMATGNATTDRLDEVLDAAAAESDASKLDDAEIQRLVALSRDASYRRTERVPVKSIEAFEPRSLVSIAMAAQRGREEEMHLDSAAAATTAADQDASSGALVVDGLAMLVADHKRRMQRRRSSLGPARKAIAARRSSPKKPLAAKN